MSESHVNTTHKIKATEQQIDEILTYYNGYLSFNTSPYIVARVKLSNSTITIYKTNVVLFQGEGETKEYNFWAKKFNLPVEESLGIDYEKYFSLSAIGSDEVGTGDYFGPIVVCATYVAKDAIEKLQAIGVKDSKLLTDNQMIPMALKISEVVKYSIMILEPEKINNLNSNCSNLNFIKSYLHNKAILSLQKKLEETDFYDAILIDEFTPKDKYFDYLKHQSVVERNVTLIPKGEKANIAIAAASVLARVAFLRELNKMNTTYKTTFLKGAGPEVDRCSISFVKTHGWDELKKVAKLKWANTERIIAYFKENPLPKSRQGHFYDNIN